MFAVRASTCADRDAEKTRALRAFTGRPLAAASPIAIRQAISRAVMARMVAPPRMSATTPARVVTKNSRMSASATTLVWVRDSSQ